MEYCRSILFRTAMKQLSAGSFLKKFSRKLSVKEQSHHALHFLIKSNVVFADVIILIERIITEAEL